MKLVVVEDYYYEGKNYSAGEELDLTVTGEIKELMAAGKLRQAGAVVGSVQPDQPTPVAEPVAEPPYEPPPPTDQ